MNSKPAIQSILEGKGMTSAHLAAKLHDMGFAPHPLTVDRWVKGECEPRGFALTCAIAKALNCEVSDLVSERVAS